MAEPQPQPPAQQPQVPIINMVAGAFITILGTVTGMGRALMNLRERVDQLQNRIVVMEKSNVCPVKID